jgi:hypothetical protein
MRSQGLQFLDVLDGHALTKRVRDANFRDLRYTGFTLSDLDASCDLALEQGQSTWHRFSPKPLQRVPISLLPGDYIRNRVTVGE